jgi:lysophospholipase L1-like esterase
MILQPNDKLVMIGDSVTDCGRAQPVGEGLFNALGNGYVSLVDSILTVLYPERSIRVVNMGLSGNTVRDLKMRWQRDVIEQKPDWVSIMIGINDVWRQFDCPRQKEIHVYPEEYSATLEEIIVQTKPIVKGIVMMTPYYLEPNREDAMRKRMDQYGAIVRDIATRHQTLFVDTQEEMNGILNHYNANAIAWDRVHPNHIGHMALAKAFLASVGLKFDKIPKE